MTQKAESKELLQRATAGDKLNSSCQTHLALRKGIQFNYAVSVCKVKRSLNFTLT